MNVPKFRVHSWSVWPLCVVKEDFRQPSLIWAGPTPNVTELLVSMKCAFSVAERKQCVYVENDTTEWAVAPSSKTTHHQRGGRRQPFCNVHRQQQLSDLIGGESSDFLVGRGALPHLVHPVPFGRLTAALALDVIIVPVKSSQNWVVSDQRLGEKKARLSLNISVPLVRSRWLTRLHRRHQI